MTTCSDFSLSGLEQRAVKFCKEIDLDIVPKKEKKIINMVFDDYGFPIVYNGSIYALLRGTSRHRARYSFYRIVVKMTCYFLNNFAPHLTDLYAKTKKQFIGDFLSPSKRPEPIIYTHRYSCRACKRITGSDLSKIDVVCRYCGHLFLDEI